jgi:hypothetical protein
MCSAAIKTAVGHYTTRYSMKFLKSFAMSVSLKYTASCLFLKLTVYVAPLDEHATSFLNKSSTNVLNNILKHG